MLILVLLAASSPKSTRFGLKFFFFALMQKRSKKNQGKTRSLRAFLPSPASPAVTAHFFAFWLAA
jgi:hypothetical protein